MNDDQAERLAETLVIGHKKVIDGNYAIVYKFTGNKEDEFVYYIRKDGKWILDETVGKNAKTTDDEILCNFQEKYINTYIFQHINNMFCFINLNFKDLLIKLNKKLKFIHTLSRIIISLNNLK